MIFSLIVLNSLDKWLIISYKLKGTRHIQSIKRGTIVKVDFGVNLGSEMSQVHFAIVLNNYDNNRNNVLTVVPPTSKVSKFNLNLGPLVIGKLIEKINKELSNINLNTRKNCNLKR